LISAETLRSFVFTFILLISGYGNMPKFANQRGELYALLFFLQPTEGGSFSAGFLKKE